VRVVGGGGRAPLGRVGGGAVGVWGPGIASRERSLQQWCVLMHLCCGATCAQVPGAAARGRGAPAWRGHVPVQGRVRGHMGVFCKCPRLWQAMTDGSGHVCTSMAHMRHVIQRSRCKLHGHCHDQGVVCRHAYGIGRQGNPGGGPVMWRQSMSMYE
jgi:hypothetical protein